MEYAIEELSKMENPIGFARQFLQQMSRTNPDIAEALKSPEEFARKQCASKGIDADELMKMVSARLKI